MRNSPILAGLNSLLSLLSSLEKENSLQNKKENRIKLLVCDILDYLILKREDSVIDNMIQWFKEMQDQASIEKEVKEDIKSMIPDIFPSGIQKIDEIFNPQNGLLAGNINILFAAAGGNIKLKKNFAFPSLNELYSKKAKDSILPSIFKLFLTSNDKIVETKSIKLITKLYSQYEGLIKNMKSLEIVFDQEESKIYLFLQDLITAAKYLIEKCEVKICLIILLYF